MPGKAVRRSSSNVNIIDDIIDTEDIPGVGFCRSTQGVGSNQPCRMHDTPAHPDPDLRGIDERIFGQRNANRLFDPDRCVLFWWFDNDTVDDIAAARYSPGEQARQLI
jgi:hypothetical protein